MSGPRTVSKAASAAKNGPKSVVWTTPWRRGWRRLFRAPTPSMSTQPAPSKGDRHVKRVG